MHRVAPGHPHRFAGEPADLREAQDGEAQRGRRKGVVAGLAPTPELDLADLLDPVGADEREVHEASERDPAARKQRGRVENPGVDRRVAVPVDADVPARGLVEHRVLLLLEARRPAEGRCVRCSTVELGRDGGVAERVAQSAAREGVLRPGDLGVDLACEPARAQVGRAAQQVRGDLGMRRVVDGHRAEASDAVVRRRPRRAVFGAFAAYA